MHAFLLTSRYFITTSCIERQGAPTFPIFLSAKVLLQYDDFFFPRKLKWCYSEQRILRNFSTSKFPSCLPCIVKLWCQIFPNIFYTSSYVYSEMGMDILLTVFTTVYALVFGHRMAWHFMVDCKVLWHFQAACKKPSPVFNWNHFTNVNFLTENIRKNH